MTINKILKPKYNYDLIRLGKDFDGGYLVGENSVRGADYLISFGINEDWSFEKDFKSRKGRKSKFRSLLIEKDFEPENPKQLEELDENSCKWPIGHPDEKSFYFCGRSSLKDFSYCKLHLLYAYQPKGKKEEIDNKDEMHEYINKKTKSA